MEKESLIYSYGKFAQFKFDSNISIVPVCAPLYLFRTFFIGFVFIWYLFAPITFTAYDLKELSSR